MHVFTHRNTKNVVPNMGPDISPYETAASVGTCGFKPQQNMSGWWLIPRQK
jgi:hypothetical protein